MGPVHPASFTAAASKVYGTALGWQPVAWSAERETRGTAPDREGYACPDRSCPVRSASLRVMVAHVRREHREDAPPSYTAVSRPPSPGRSPGEHATMSADPDAAFPDLTAGTCVPGRHPARLDGAWEAESGELRKAAVHACQGCAVLAACTDWALSLNALRLHDNAIIAGMTREGRRLARRARTAAQPDDWWNDRGAVG